MIFEIKSVNQSIYDKNIRKSIIGSHHDKATDFHARKTPEAGSNCICWSVILIDFVLEKDENYYPLVFKRM